MLNTECKICRPLNNHHTKIWNIFENRNIYENRKIKIALLLFESFHVKNVCISNASWFSACVYLLTGLKFDLLLVIVNIFLNYIMTTLMNDTCPRELFIVFEHCFESFKTL